MLYDLFKEYKELKAEVLGSCCFLNDGKGNFTKIELPEELQLAPLFAFTAVPFAGANSFLAGGNFYGVIPYEGRYDAQTPVFFFFDNKANRFVINADMPSVYGEVRDIKTVTYPDGSSGIIIARNNEGLLFYTTTKK